MLFKLKYSKVDIIKILFFLLSSIILLFHSFYYLPFISDDSLISLQYAKRLLQGKGLTWTDGVPVEGYSNLLWILLISLFGLFKIDLIFLVRFLGIAFNILTLFIFFLIYDKLKYKNIFVLLLVSLYYVFSGPIAVWAIGGMEQPLLNFLFAVSFYYTIDLINNKITKKNYLKIGIFFGLMCLTRNDSILFVLILMVSFIILNGLNKKNIINIFYFILPVIILIGAQIIFRIFYYGDIIPNPAYIKLGISKWQFDSGIVYLKNGFKSQLPVILFILVFFILSFKDKLLILLFSYLSIWLLYLLLIGGDILPAYRHITIVILIINFILIISLNNFLNLYKKSKILNFTIIFLFCVLLLFHFKGQFNDRIIKKAKAELWEWEGKEIAFMLKNGFNEPKPTVVTSSAGSIPFWSDLPVIDSLGLNDYYIPRYSKKNPLDKRIGHNMGDGYYILAREPDIIIFCGPWGSIGPCYTSEAQIADSQEFKNNYVPVLFKIENINRKITSIMWINKNSSKIGIKYNDNKIYIPAYLLSDDLRNPVFFDNKKNQFEIIISKTVPAIVKNIELDKGNYIIGTDKEISGYLEIKNIFSNKIRNVKINTNIYLIKSKYEIKLYTDKQEIVNMVIINKTGG